MPRRTATRICPPLLLLVPLLMVFGGCTLIDQRTFAPEPDMPAPTLIAGAALPENRVPLVTIRYETASPAYQGPLNAAVKAAESQRPNLEYDVVAIIPRVRTPDAQAAQINAGQTDAAEIMRAIVMTGIQDNRVRLFARIDPKAETREVRVYVR
ncbi:hypothetical protein [Acidisphaera rubrifaciens]|uniref:Lipoprotein n=1 Tax=Acidisphaera rubrifaciens HS-AP3 TaxID=1231350 RepID=A0A0D6P482_9PROT|nr:hypothetical protein [Acidisphaera rubrifaciens]GAN76013.1 hypothetical protein Asru_0045_04 [Acidisphaera rubrifaciens HS-AP3]